MSNTRLYPAASIPDRVYDAELCEWTPFDTGKHLRPQQATQAQYEIRKGDIVLGILIGVVVSEFIRWALWRGFDNFFDQQ